MSTILPLVTVGSQHVYYLTSSENKEPPGSTILTLETVGSNKVQYRTTSDNVELPGPLPEFLCQ